MQKELRERAEKVAKLMIKTLGRGAVMLMSSDAQSDVEVTRTGSMGLDRALGVGGLPTGRIVEIYGPESSGKTTLMLSLIAQAQKAGRLAAFVDAEHALDPQYAAKIGVDMDSLLVSQPDSGEQALQIVEHLIAEGDVDLVVVDSVSALVPKAEIAGEIGDQHVGLQARLMSQALRKLAPIAYKSASTVAFINQIRSKIGVSFGVPETTSGGRALRFYASVRLDIRRIATLKDAGLSYGNRVRVKVVKNKVAPPHRSTEFDIVYGKGIDTLGELIDLATEAGVVKKSGAWFSFNNVQLAQGRGRSIARLLEKPELVSDVESALLSAWAGSEKGCNASKMAA